MGKGPAGQHLDTNGWDLPINEYNMFYCNLFLFSQTCSYNVGTGIYKTPTFLVKYNISVVNFCFQTVKYFQAG